MLGFTRPALPTAAARDNAPWRRITARAVDDRDLLFYMADDDTGERYLGAFYTCSTMVGCDQSTVDRFRSTLSVPLPPGSIVQFGLLSSPDVEDILASYLDNKRCDDPLLTTMAKQRHDFILSGRDHPLVSRSGVLLHTKTVIVTIKVPCKGTPDDKQIKEAMEICDRFAEGLRTAGLDLVAEGAGGYLKFMRRLTHIYDAKDDRYDEDRPLREQIFGPGDFLGDETVRLQFNDEYYAKVLSPKFYPRRTSLSVMAYLIGDPDGLSNQITHPFFVQCTLHYPDQAAKKTGIATKYTAITHQSWGPMAEMIPSLRYKKQGFEPLMTQIEGNNATVVEQYLAVVLFARDSDSLNKLAASICSYESSLGFTFKEDKRILRPLWNAILPLNTSLKGIDRLDRFATHAVPQAVSFLPVFGDWQGTGSGSASVFVSRRGQPVLIDVFDSETNPHAIFAAETRSGKSTLVQQLIQDQMSSGARIWVIEKGHSYQKLNRWLEPQGLSEYIEFDDHRRISLNPFTHVDDIHEEMPILVATLTKMATPMAGLNDWTNFHSAALQEAISSVWNERGSTMEVNEVAEWCTSQSDTRIRDIGRLLYPYTRLGPHGRWFEGPNNLDFHRDFVLLELQGLSDKPDLRKVVLIQVMARIMHDMYSDIGRRKIMVVEEADEHLNDPVMAQALDALYRRAAKHGGAMWLVIQGIADLYNSAHGETIYNNSAHKFIMSQRPEAIDSIIKTGKLKIEPYGAEVMKSVHTVKGKYAEFMLMRSPTDWGVMRHMMDRFSYVLTSSQGAEREVVLAAINSGRPVQEVIDQFLADHPD